MTTTLPTLCGMSIARGAGMSTKSKRRTAARHPNHDLTEQDRAIVGSIMSQLLSLITLGAVEPETQRVA